MVVVVLVAEVAARTARRFGLGLEETEGLRDLLDGVLADLGLPRTPRSVIAQLRRQAARLRTGLTVETVLAPTRITANVHPRDFALVARYRDRVGDAVAGASHAAARRRGWQSAGRPRVELVADAAVRRGRPLLRASYGSGPSDRAHPPEAGHPGSPSASRVGDTTLLLPERRPSPFVAWVNAGGDVAAPGGHGGTEVELIE